MVNVAIVAAKLADRAARARTLCPSTPEELRSDRNALDLVAFNLMLAVQSCADVASHLIADEGWPPAKTLAAAFETLATQGVIADKTARALARAVGLRNIVAHGYAGIDIPIVHAAATHGVADLDRFAREVATWMATRSP
jgi:uncharacterized protein YutE (UPF0331/DUF86 family)